MRIGDAVLLKKDNTCNIAGIEGIRISGKEVRVYNIADQDSPTLLLDVKLLEVIENDQGLMHWTGKYKDATVVRILGASCTPIKPELDFNHPDGTTIFAFQKSLMMDMSLLLGDSNQDEIQEGVTIPCKICGAKVKLENMRCHVGIHILKEELTDRCGFCGLVGCHSSLKKTSRQGNKIYYKTTSNCPYFFNWGRAPKKCTQRNKCTNHLIRCVICGADIWKYNLPAHYELLHIDTELSAELCIEEKERKMLL